MTLSLAGSPSFLRLWLAQVVSSLGDWIGLVAVLSVTARVGGTSPEAAIALVMSARMIPGFFLASVGGVLVDRWNRKRVMVACDIGRGLVLLSLPTVDTVQGLFVASLALEVLTLLWSPAKEASVPNLVDDSQLTRANSLSLVAAYGTFPIGSALFASLTKVSQWLADQGMFESLRLNQETLAIYGDVLTFFASAVLISTLALPDTRPDTPRGKGQGALAEIREGWRFVGSNKVVRAVILGLGTGLIGGGMIAPLGPTYSTEVLKAGPPGFGLLLTALGSGLAVGVVALSALQNRLDQRRMFPLAVLGAGACMLAAVSTSTLAVTMTFIAGMGICAGAVYVLGFTILGQSVDNNLRGRTFATLYTLSRLCLLISLSLAPLLASILDGVTPAPGVRVTLWLGSAVILLAGVGAMRNLWAPVAGSSR
ncbi:MAG: MFS transporter [Acidimicrobiales bacterium]